MADYQRIVEDLRAFVGARDQVVTEPIRQAAAAYAAACQEANQRLRRCAEFLQQGLYTEAIHLADTEPVLLDAVAVLDFPERKAWDAVCSGYGMPAAPALYLEAARALNEAYARAQPLESLLREHRLLALARAPLSARLSVMRQIAELDRDNPVWAEDVREFEQVRLRQLSAEVEEAAARNDSGVLASYWDEIAGQDWLVEPPPRLVGRVERLARQGKSARVRAALEKLARELHDAHSAGDVERGRWLRERWKEELPHADLPLEDPLWDQVSPALHWLATQDRRDAEERTYQNTLTGLERALENGADTEELERLYFAVLKYKQGVPEAVETRYRERVRSLRRSRQWRDRFILAATFSAGAIVLVACVAFLVSRARTGRAVERATADLQRLLDEDRIDEANEYLHQLARRDPRTANHEEVVALEGRVAERTREHQRAANFHVALEEARRAPLGDGGTAAVAKAQALARRPEDRLAVQGLVEERARRQRAETFRDNLTNFEGEVARLERLAGGEAPAREVNTLLARLETELARLRRESDALGDLDHEKLTALAARVDKVRQRLVR